MPTTATEATTKNAEIARRIFRTPKKLISFLIKRPLSPSRICAGVLLEAASSALTAFSEGLAPKSSS